ncbi:MAG: DUF4336 domain-containing protein [Parvibaculum sp.]|uniref:DUF4336 domain-containing protein n=1 Tax=Parvibaculum sp. TaxID=2024848 RepID=UPI0025D1AB6C|nr:DUF4336 domain-containing protein [Parvibaculum sp.]MCE9650655.1 DUF4336 domain-containing protein [Parvibaculum sp.]
MFDLDSYAPINTLKPFAEDVWIVDGPVIRMKWLWTSLPFPTRMTVARLSDGGLWVHSPTELTTTLKTEIDALGPVRFLVAPNKIHYWWVRDWQIAYPEALSFAAPRVEETARKRGAVFTRVLGAAPVPEWRGEIEHVPVSGKYMTEVDFFHQASRTLILTDLIENFEPAKLHGRLWRFICRMGGVLDPHGSMPRDLRATFAGQKDEVKRAVETMIGWHPERIVVAHGRCYQTDAEAELRRAFRWAGV